MLSLITLPHSWWLLPTVLSGSQIHLGNVATTGLIPDTGPWDLDPVRPPTPSSGQKEVLPSAAPEVFHSRPTWARLTPSEGHSGHGSGLAPVLGLVGFTDTRRSLACPGRPGGVVGSAGGVRVFAGRGLGRAGRLERADGPDEAHAVAYGVVQVIKAFSGPWTS